MNEIDMELVLTKLDLKMQTFKKESKEITLAINKLEDKLIRAESDIYQYVNDVMEKIKDGNR